MAERPVGITILSILSFVGVGIGFLFGLIMIIVGNVFREALSDSFLFGNLGAILVIGIGVFLIIYSIISYFLTIGLWRLKQWARITWIVLIGISLVSSLISIVISIVSSGDMVSLGSSIPGIAINVFIIYYLIANEEVKQAFA